MCGLLVTTDCTLDVTAFRDGLSTLQDRGPDDERWEKVNGGILGFARLAIMGCDEKGMQPFHFKKNVVVCNGELYGFRAMKKELQTDGYKFISDSDCELLLPLYEKYGTEMFAHLDSEFACVIYDGEKDSFLAARDPIGIRPLFYGYTENKKMIAW